MQNVVQHNQRKRSSTTREHYGPAVPLASAAAVAATSSAAISTCAGITAV